MNFYEVREWVGSALLGRRLETAARLHLDTVPIFEQKPQVFDPAVHKELAIYFCDTWSKLAVKVVDAILRRGLPPYIIHINVNPKRAEAFQTWCEKITAANGWDPHIAQVIDEPYRDLYASVARILQELREQYPDVYFEVYIGALRAHFPYNWLHMSTDRFLRDAMMEVENVALNIKQVNLDSLPLPADFKVTFEHSTDQHHQLAQRAS